MTVPGVIVRVVHDKGFGFVKRVDGDIHYFFHRSALVGPTPFELLRAGQSVTFKEGATTVKGPRAVKVTVA